MIVKKIWLLLLVFLFSLTTGCEKAADISKPSRYEKNGITFSYPGNWKVSEDAVSEYMRYLIIESPGNALFIAQVYPKSNALGLDEFAKWFSDEAKHNTPIGSIEKSSFSVMEKSFGQRKITGITEQFSIVLLGEDIPHVREYYTIESSDKIVFMIGQSSTEDYARIEPGLSLIMSTFETKAPNVQENSPPTK